MTVTHKSACIACGTANEKSALYCASCGNYLPRNYFDMLDIERTATTAAIRDAYIKKAVDCRPEKTRHLSLEFRELAAKKLQQLNLIWDTLRDDQKRRDYIADLERQEQLADVHHRRALEALLWRRGCARYIDYILFAALLITCSNAVYPGLLEWSSLNATMTDYLLLVAGIFSFGLLTISAWVPLEVLLLATLGTTPGKWLYRLQVVDNNQAKLSFKMALSRALQVWNLGMGGGILAISPFTNMLWHNRVKQGKPTIWDNHYKTEIIEQPVSAFRLAASSVIVMQALSLAYFLLGPLPNGEDVAYAHNTSTILAPGIAPTALESVTQQATNPTPLKQPSVSVNSKAIVINAGTVTDEVVLERAVSTTVEASEVPILSTANKSSTVQKNQQDSIEIMANINLPPSMRTQADSTVSMETIETAPLLQTVLQENTSSSSGQLSKEDRLSCVQRYYAMMSEAQALPLGDYARINRQAMRERERCFAGG